MKTNDLLDIIGEANDEFIHDIESYELQGYLDGSCTPGEEIDDVSATVTREEMILGEILREIAEIRYAAISANEFDGDHNRYLDKQISLDMYYQAIVKHFATYGPLGADPKERYAFGMLTDVISEVTYHDRILYFSFEVTIPAGSSVEVNVEQFKYASFDFDCSGSENAGINGYDMVTSLGSNIAFTGQMASISNYDTIEIVRQNFGFDIAGGITNVDLALRRVATCTTKDFFKNFCDHVRNILRSGTIKCVNHPPFN